MTDTYYDPSSTGVLMPQVAAAAARDPRRLLVQSLMQQGQNSLQTPTYSPGAALAKALTIGLGGITGAKLNSDYEDQNKAVQDTMQRAITAGQGSTDPTTGQPVAGNLSEMARVLASNPLTAGQGLGIPIQQAQLQAKARVELVNELAKQHLVFDPTGKIVPMAGAPEAVKTLNSAGAEGTTSGNLTAEAAGKPAVINATAAPEANAAALKIRTTAAPEANAAALKINTTAAPEANAAALKINTTAAPEAAAAAQKSAATTPIEVFKEQFKPIVDRATGEVVIPGLDPAVTDKIMSAMGVDKKTLAGSLSGQAEKPPAEGQGVRRAAAIPAQPAAGQSAPGASQAGAAGTPVAPVPFGTKQPSEEVPRVGLPTGLLAPGPGTLIPGRDPIAIKAGEGQVDQANTLYHETQEAAKTAAASHAQLMTMRTQVENGGVTPSATAPVRFVLSSYLNATLGPQIAKSVTGIDPAEAEVLNKEATRMGLTFARQTEGAREAVAAIKIALGGNPQLGNTTPGFLKLVDLMDAGTKHDTAAQQYGDAWGEKNGHYVGFQGWITHNHPPAEFTSKVIPYNAPRARDGSVDISGLQPNVTYQGPNGPGIWTGAGFKPVK